MHSRERELAFVGVLADPAEVSTAPRAPHRDLEDHGVVALGVLPRHVPSVSGAHAAELDPAAMALLIGHRELLGQLSASHPAEHSLIRGEVLQGDDGCIDDVEGRIIEVGVRRAAAETLEPILEKGGRIGLAPAQHDVVLHTR